MLVFSTHLHNRIKKIPKFERYTLGGNLLALSQEFSALLFLARKKHDRSARLILEKADIVLSNLRFNIRIAKELKALTLAGYIELSEDLKEIGQILGGWIKNITPRE